MATLSEYLSKSGLTLAEFAQSVGSSAGYIHDVRDGRRTPSMRLAARIVDASKGEIEFASLLPKQASRKAGKL